MKYTHRPRYSNPHGSHNEVAFRPFSSDFSVRCPGCNSLLESGFLEEGRCPVCKHSWRRRKSIARNMYLEALATKVNHGGWGHPILEELEGRPSQIVSKDMKKKREIDPVVQQMAANFTAIQKAKEESMKRSRRRVA